MDTTTIEQYIRAGESLKVEFKGEQRESLSDREIYEAVVCLANADGGILLIGVENDGRLTGATTSRRYHRPVSPAGGYL